MTDDAIHQPGNRVCLTMPSWKLVETALLAKELELFHRASIERPDRLLALRKQIEPELRAIRALSFADRISRWCDEVNSRPQAATLVNGWGKAVLQLLWPDRLKAILGLWMGSCDHYVVWDAEGVALSEAALSLACDRSFVLASCKGEPKFVQKGRILAGKDPRHVALCSAAVIGMIPALSQNALEPSRNLSSFFVAFDVIHDTLAQIELAQKGRIRAIDEKRRLGRMRPKTVAKEVLVSTPPVVAPPRAVSPKSMVAWQGSIDGFDLFSDVVDQRISSDSQRIVLKHLYSSIQKTAIPERSAGELKVQTCLSVPAETSGFIENALYSAPPDDPPPDHITYTMMEFFQNSTLREAERLEKDLISKPNPLSKEQEEFVTDLRSVHSLLYKKMFAARGAAKSDIRVLARALSRLILCVRFMSRGEFERFRAGFSDDTSRDEQLWLPERSFSGRPVA